MKIKGIIEEDFIQYKKPSMFILTSTCTFKCEKECGIKGLCQNNPLINTLSKDINDEALINRYRNNPLTQAIVFGGLEPFDQFEELFNFIKKFREVSLDDIVIYTGYYKEELLEKISELKIFPSIIIKFGRYIPNQVKHRDEVLGIELASSNQAAERIS